MEIKGLKRITTEILKLVSGIFQIIKLLINVTLEIITYLTELK